MKTNKLLWNDLIDMKLFINLLRWTVRLFLRTARNNPEGLISVSGRVSRVPRQSRRPVQIVFNRSPDVGHSGSSWR